MSVSFICITIVFTAWAVKFLSGRIFYVQWSLQRQFICPSAEIREK